MINHVTAFLCLVFFLLPIILAIPIIKSREISGPVVAFAAFIVWLYLVCLGLSGVING